ncbi:MAG: TetR/AcrR family transcriptional regulator, partial [Pseudomonadota bacterium]|nr:TetR/AcrR family transcriptional regulator [Pseudomonadota bacterium]
HKGEGATTLLRVYGLTIGLWQMLDWPDNVKPLLEQNEKFKVLRPDFFAELPVALGQYLGGALLTR